MNKVIGLLASGAALVGAVAVASPASADTTSAPTAVATTKCSAWKLHGDRFIQSCVEITGTQVHTYGLVSSAGAGPAHDTAATVTGRLGDGTGLGYQPGVVHIDNDTLRVEGASVTVPAGTSVRSTVFLPGVAGTGTLVGPDGATFVDPDVPRGPAGPGGSQSPVTEQITVWATVTG